MVGITALLDFTPRLMLGDEELTPEEIADGLTTKDLEEKTGEGVEPVLGCLSAPMKEGGAVTRTRASTSNPHHCALNFAL